MVKDHMTIMHDLRNYASPKARLTRMIKSGEVIRVRRSFFLDADDRNYSPKSLAALIYGPSYISFESALSYYGLIPERVAAITSAVFNKNKNRAFHTPVGDFYYYYLPPAVYPYGVVRRQENNQGFLIASPEKALCDALYKVKGISSRDALVSLLFEDLRMDRAGIAAMDRAALLFLAPLYRKKIFPLFLEWLKLEAGGA